MIDCYQSFTTPNTYTLYEVKGEKLKVKGVLEDNAEVAAKWKAYALPEPELERKMYDEAINKLAGNGLYQYEISNFAQKGFECKHNIGYANSFKSYSVIIIPYL